MTFTPGQFRPFHLGEKNRQVYDNTNDWAPRALNDANGNPLYLGIAQPGTQEQEQKWQIRKIDYDANQGVVRVTWPQNSEGNASRNFEFIWQTDTTVAITGITQANPGVVTTGSAHGYSDGDFVIIEGVVGMTEVNYDNTSGTLYIVANSTATTFELTDIDGANVDTSAFTAYSSGGTVTAANFANYTYS
jgi:hypothetical protein